MNRIDTAAISDHALLNIQKAQEALHDATRRSSTQTRAEDAKGYNTDTQWLISSKTLLSSLQNRREQTAQFKSRLELQDLALNKAVSSLQKLKNTALQALSLNSGSGLDAALQESFAELKSSLNLRHNGQYLFGGSLSDRPPISAQSFDSLLAEPISQALETEASEHLLQLDGQQVAAAPKAAQLAEPALHVLQTLGNLHAGDEGPFDHPLTEIQKNAITAQLQSLDNAFNTLLQAQTDNGLMFKRAEETEIRLGAESNMLEHLIGERTQVDLAEIAARLSKAQTAYQASASIFNTLRGLNLLDIL